MVGSLDYAPIPDSVVQLIGKSWSDKIQDSAGKPLRS